MGSSNERQASYDQRLLIARMTSISYFGLECSFARANHVIGLAMQYRRKYGKKYREPLLRKLEELKVGGYT